MTHHQMDLCKSGLWRRLVSGLIIWCVFCTNASGQTYSKIETIEYHDDLTNWVLGQIKRTTTNGIETSRVDFDARSQAIRLYDFGKLVEQRAYHADGQLAVVTDGNGNATRLDDYIFGIPRLIRFADGTRQIAGVDGNGQIAWVNDESLSSTCYSYDVMGRLSMTTYPSETQAGTCDESAWTAQRSEFRPLSATDWRPPGVQTGQWVQSIIRGNHHTMTYYDALWRPVLTHEYDASQVVNTMRATSTEYDAAGHVSFRSYPSSDFVPPALGTWTNYDALGRVTAVSQDSEQGVLTTFTDYLPGFRTRVINPRGAISETSYQAYDQPSYEMPVSISHPEGAYTYLSRDAFGKPTRIVRRDAAGTVQAARYYVYQGDQKLCKVLEPETGATVYGYDAAGNLTNSASGLWGLDDLATCNQAQAWDSGRMSTRTYDARNRLKILNFPDGEGNQSWEYTSTGKPRSVQTQNHGGAQIVNSYVYNHRGQLTGEAMEQVAWYQRAVGYAYDRLGHLTAQTYPSGLIIHYAPNALGQATQAIDQTGYAYARAAEYAPNGSLRSLHYGNGLRHSTVQNTRQLPARITDSEGAQDLDLRYDRNGNISDIYDGLGGYYDRHMVYDGLDRLTHAGAVIFGGDAWHRFSYDVLDNLKSWTLQGSKDYSNYIYDGHNRLTNIQNAAGATVLGVSYDAQGNVVNKNGRTFAFTLANRLRESDGPEGYQYYRYDAFGRRVMMWNPIQLGALYLYSQTGQLLLEENHRDGRQNESIYLGNRLVALREYDYRNGALRPLFQHTDFLGSPIAVSDPSGNVIKRSLYEPYGKVINQPDYGGIGYTGHVQDAATGLTYMQQRYYDPQLGRFLSVDPVTAYSNPVGAFNRYWYANNNPYRFTDPDGRNALVIEIGVPILIAGTIYYVVMTPQQRQDAARAIGRAWESLRGSALPILQKSESSEGDAPPLPGGLVGTEDSGSRQQGGRVNNGPLAPQNKGTGNAETDFGTLTGGKSGSAPEGSRLPEGSRVGENGVIYRPGNGSSGPRIDIPANGDKPHETLHYPKPPPPTEKQTP